MIITRDSHLDHGLTEEHKAYVLHRFGKRDAFFIETVELPDYLPALMSALYGPLAGDDAVPEEVVDTATQGLYDNPDIAFIRRGVRTHRSRILVDAKSRPTRLLTVIGGPHGTEPCILYTAFGGSATPKEPSDPTLKPDEHARSIAFWKEHALAEDVCSSDDLERYKNEDIDEEMARVASECS